MNSEFKKDRVEKILIEAIKKNNLDLSGLVVFTEAASGNYAYIPIGAAIAGAKKVYALTKDSKYGKKEEIKQNIYHLANEFGVKDKIQVIFEKNRDAISVSDIITNSGFVRPIDKNMIDMMKSTAVISLMWEPWEFRNEEIDLEYCQTKEIVVLGTNESDSVLNIDKGIGFMAIKMLFELGLSVYNDNILIISECPIGDSIKKVFDDNKISVDIYGVNINKKDEIKNKLSTYDAIIVAEHIKKNLIIGDLSSNSLIDINELLKFNIPICHICGNIQTKKIRDKGILLYPKNIASYGYVSYSLNNMGEKGIIELNMAGLKVGEIVVKNRFTNLTYQECITESVKNNLVLGF